MRYLFIIASFILIASSVRAEGSELDNFDKYVFGHAVMTGSGSLDINPLLNLDACTGSGTIDLNFSQGISDIITWNDGSNAVERVGLGAGDYFVDLTIDGCDTTIFFSLEFPDLLTATVTNLVDKNCVAGTLSNPVLGSFTVNPVGGMGPYLYSINGEPSQLSNQFNDLEEGTYTIDITDANGCETQIVQEIRCIGCSISPNPIGVGDQFFVNAFFGDASETAQIRIYNASGRQVYQENLNVTSGGITSFPISADLEPGMYIVLITGDTVSFSRQLIVVE